MSPEELCRPLAWDSEHFGFPIAMIEGRRLDAAAAARAVDGCRELGIRCAYFLADPADYETAREAQRHGFVPVGLRVTFEQCLTSEPGDEEESSAVAGPESGRGVSYDDAGPLVDARWTPVQTRAAERPQGVADLGVGIRPAVADDLPSIRQMAVQSYLDSRFYFDPRFDRDRCDALYVRWAESAFRENDVFFIAEAEGAAVGYVTCKLSGPTAARIQLLGVVPRSQGQGIGRMLVEACLRWMIWREIDCVSVATHGRNLRSQRLYQRCGFLVQQIEQWYHRWFD